VWRRKIILDISTLLVLPFVIINNGFWGFGFAIFMYITNYAPCAWLPTRYSVRKQALCYKESPAYYYYSVFGAGSI